MPNDQNAQAPNPLDMWRQYITDSERQWNGFFKDVLGTDTMSNGMNAWVEASLTVQRMVADQLERLYTTFNIPTHADLMSLGERMKSVEESLGRMEAMMAAAPRRAGALPKGARAKTPKRARPPRTKRPPVAAGVNGVSASS